MIKKVTSNSYSNLKKGFTLIEISVVVAIIGILTTIAIFAGTSAKSLARDNQRKTDIKLLQVKLEAYRAQYGVYPESLSGDEKSLTKPGSEGNETQAIVPASVMPKDPLPTQSYIYIPLNFSGGTCGMSYYLYATLENDTTDEQVLETLYDDLEKCAGSDDLPSELDSKIYDVISPSAFTQ